MRNRIWYELCQAKHNHRYCILLLAYRRRLLNTFGLIILIFSGGVMGWGIWKEVPLVACIIIASIQLLRIVQPHLIPSEKQVDKLDSVTDFYFEYFNKLEKLWMSYERDELTEESVQNLFYDIKDTEKQVNKTLNEIIKTTNKKILAQASAESTSYLTKNLN